MDAPSTRLERLGRRIPASTRRPRRVVTMITLTKPIERKGCFFNVGDAE